MTFLISADRDNWTCSTEYASRNEAVANGMRELGLLIGMRFFTGVKGPPTEITPNAEHIIEMIAGIAYEQDGEASADWLDNPSKKELGGLQHFLDQAWRRWLETFPHHKPWWFMVTEVQEHVAMPQSAPAQ
jgi:hypothetical protein